MRFERKTIAIMFVAIIGLSLFVGLASAAGTNPGANPLSQILEQLLGIETSISKLQTSIDQQQQNCLILDSNLLIESGSETHIVLPEVEGRVYSGHITCNVAAQTPSVSVEVRAILGDETTVLGGVVLSDGVLDADFVCQHLDFFFVNLWAGPRVIEIKGVITYTNITNVDTWSP